MQIGYGTISERIIREMQIIDIASAKVDGQVLWKSTWCRTGIWTGQPFVDIFEP